MSYCTRCERQFKSEHILDQHLKHSYSHHICDKCNKDFETKHKFTQHYITSPHHFYCHRCEKHLDDDEDLEKHYEADHLYCRICSKFFDSEDGLGDHRRDKHWYCASCKRLFQSEDNLNTHLHTSAVHNERRLPCPGLNCTKTFISYSDITMHLESGACRSQMDRQDVNTIAAQLDRSHIVTSPGHSITAPDSSFAPPMIQAYATERSFNGYEYECLICHKTFKTLSSLNLHLNSPVHDQRIYRCPTVFSGCGAEFKTLSGFIRHVESGSCGIHWLLKGAPELDAPAFRIIAPHTGKTETKAADKSGGGFGDVLGGIAWIILFVFLASWYFGPHDEQKSVSS